MSQVEPSAPQRAGANQGLLLICLGSLVTLAIVSLVPNLPQLFQRFSNVPNFDYYVPMIITVPSLCIAFTAPIMGALADFWGRRRLLLAALVLYSVVGILPLFFSDLFSIIYSRIGVGLAEAAILTVGNALMGDYFSGDERRKWLGLQATIGTVIASGAMLAGGRLGSINWHAPFLVYLVGLLLLAWAAVSLFEPDHAAAAAHAAAERAAAGEAAASIAMPFPWGAAVITGVATIGVAALYYVQAIQLGRMFDSLGVDTPARISNFTSVASFGVLAGGYSYRYVGRAGIARSLIAILGLMGLGYVGIARSPNPYIGLVFALIAQFANGLALPALLNWTLGKYDFANRGRGMGIWGSCFFAATFLSPPMVAVISQSTGGFLPALQVLGITSLIVAALILVFARRPAAASTNA
jgi:MFS family permease